MRIECCIQYCMELEQQAGNLYQENETFRRKIYGWLNHGYQEEVVTQKQISAVLNWLVGQGKLRLDRGALYPEKMFEYECLTAKKLAALLEDTQREKVDTEPVLDQAEQELSISLSAKQKEAVRKAFAYPVSIITGGPGTGKPPSRRFCFISMSIQRNGPSCSQPLLAEQAEEWQRVQDMRKAAPCTAPLDLEWKRRREPDLIF